MSTMEPRTSPLTSSFMSSISGSFLGHQSRCFDIQYDSSRNFLLTASEDGSAKLFNCLSKKCLFTFQHNQEAEVLRVNFITSPSSSPSLASTSTSSNPLCKIITCGSDGKAYIWVENSIDNNDITIDINFKIS